MLVSLSFCISVKEVLVMIIDFNGLNVIDKFVGYGCCYV